MHNALCAIGIIYSAPIDCICDFRFDIPAQQENSCRAARPMTSGALRQIYRNAIAAIVVIETHHSSYILSIDEIYTLLRTLARAREGDGERVGRVKCGKRGTRHARDRNRTYKVRDTRHNAGWKRYSPVQRFLYSPTTGGSRRNISDNLDRRWEWLGNCDLSGPIYQFF